MDCKLSQEDIELIVKALSDICNGGIMYNNGAKDLAVRQRVEQIKEKLGVKE